MNCCYEIIIYIYSRCTDILRQTVLYPCITNVIFANLNLSACACNFNLQMYSYMYLLQAVTYIRLPFQTRTSICTREQLIKLTFSVCYITDNCAQHEIHVIFSLSLYSYNLLITWNSRGKKLRHVENFFVTWKSFNLFSNKFSFKIHMNALLFVKITCGTVGCCSQYFA